MEKWTSRIPENLKQPSKLNGVKSHERSEDKEMFWHLFKEIHELQRLQWVNYIPSVYKCDKVMGCAVLRQRRLLLVAIKRTGKLWSGWGNSQPPRSWVSVEEEGISLFGTSKTNRNSGLVFAQCTVASFTLLLFVVCSRGWILRRFVMSAEEDVQLCECVFVPGGGTSAELNLPMLLCMENRMLVCLTAPGLWGFYWHNQQAHESQLLITSDFIIFLVW